MAFYVVNFIRASVIYLVLGATLGAMMNMDSTRAILTSLGFSNWNVVHNHINTLGWVSMMIYGVGYHVLPRFQGRMIYSEGMAVAHFWLANISLAGLAAFWLANQLVLVGFFGALQLLSIYMFAANILLTLARGHQPR